MTNSRYTDLAAALKESQRITEEIGAWKGKDAVEHIRNKRDGVCGDCEGKLQEAKNRLLSITKMNHNAGCKIFRDKNGNLDNFSMKIGVCDCHVGEATAAFLCLGEL